MARIRFGDQISPQVSRVALGGAATIQASSVEGF